MNKHEEILNELKEIAPLLMAVNKQPVYTVPKDFFSNLSNKILACCKITLPSNLTLSTIYSVPENYFNTFPSAILKKIKLTENEVSEELQQIAPLLNTISKKNIYSIPTNYFEQIKIPITKTPAKTISFSKTRKWISYAAAAVMAGVLVTGAFFYVDHSSSYDVTNEIKKASDDELNSYADENSVSFNEDSLINENEQELLNIEDGLKSVSNEELENYLQENTENNGTEVSLKYN